MEEDGVQIPCKDLSSAQRCILALVDYDFNFFCAQSLCSGNARTAFPAAMLQKIMRA